MKPFTTIAVFILILFGLVHLARLLIGWPVLVNGYAMPMGVSVIALIVSWALAMMVWKEHRAGS